MFRRRFLFIWFFLKKFQCSSRTLTFCSDVDFWSKIHPKFKISDKINSFKLISIFLLPFRSLLADALVEEHYKSGDEIITQGWRFFDQIFKNICSKPSKSFQFQSYFFSKFDKKFPTEKLTAKFSKTFAQNHQNHINFKHNFFKIWSKFQLIWRLINYPT